MQSRGCSRFIIARLNGDEMESGYKDYRRLVELGAAGFIIFGGDLEVVKRGIRKLQAEASLPLIISSDLERGLGQQLTGGTDLPPAMALGRAWRREPDRVRQAFSLVAAEAAYAGINTIFAPVLDIDSNPDNPIISTRAFGRDPETVTTLSCAMIEAFRSHGITSCGKHFPGHGDTDMDSHIDLPTIGSPLNALRSRELRPFAEAIGCGVPMLMTGHLRVPALDPTGAPVTLSGSALRYLREDMGFGEGLITTDAMDMGAIQEYGEAEAARMALEAGADILLHPANPEELIAKLEDYTPPMCRLDRFRTTMAPISNDTRPEVEPGLLEALADAAIDIHGDIKRLNHAPPLVLALCDDNDKRSPGAEALAHTLATEAIIIRCDEEIIQPPEARDLIVTISSSVRAYKGGSARWMAGALKRLGKHASALVSFSAPNLIERLKTDAARVYAYWDSSYAGHAVTRIINNQ